jgi:hypothetical protein
MTTVFCTFQVPGFHNWEGAPDEFAYLRSVHRHMFHVCVSTKVLHNDRDIEFIWMKAVATSEFSSLGTKSILGIEFGGKSCEMLATELMQKLHNEEHWDVVSISVSEDGENGATVTFEDTKQ